MFYLGEIISLAVFVTVVLAGCVGLYLVIRSFHRKWKWEDQVHENAIRKGILEELDVQYEVDKDGIIIARSRKKSH